MSKLFTNDLYKSIQSTKSKMATEDQIKHNKDLLEKHNEYGWLADYAAMELERENITASKFREIIRELIDDAMTK